LLESLINYPLVLVVFWGVPLCVYMFLGLFFSNTCLNNASELPSRLLGGFLLPVFGVSIFINEQLGMVVAVIIGLCINSVFLLRAVLCLKKKSGKKSERESGDTRKNVT
jgi:MFS superfamily sulfate permease-like transporter